MIMGMYGVIPMQREVPEYRPPGRPRRDRAKVKAARKARHR